MKATRPSAGSEGKSLTRGIELKDNRTHCVLAVKFVSSLRSSRDLDGSIDTLASTFSRISHTRGRRGCAEISENGNLSTSDTISVQMSENRGFLANFCEECYFGRYSRALGMDDSGRNKMQQA